MHLDIDTLLFSSLSSRCSYLLVFVLIGLSQHRQGYMLHWAASIIMSMAGAWATAKLNGYPILAAFPGFVVYAVFGSSIALCWSGIRLFRGAALRWTEVLLFAWLPGAAFSGALLLGCPGSVALAGMFVAMAVNLARAVAEVMLSGAAGRLWSRYVVAAPLAAYLAMILASLLAGLAGSAALDGPTRVSLSLIVDQGCSVLVYTGLLAMSGERAHAKLKQIATLDPLTALANRQGLASTLDGWGLRRRGAMQPACVVLFDIDHFKAINDGHGHAAGDAVLVEFARRARRVFTHPQDIVVRWGGEEFLVVMRDTDREAGLRRAESLRAATEAAVFRIDGAEIAVTVSGGVAEARDGARDVDATVARADAALYAAKRQGRNRIATLLEAQA